MAKFYPNDLVQGLVRLATFHIEFAEITTMDPWYKIATPRKEVREGRSFNPDEFAIALEQVVADKGAGRLSRPGEVFSRTCFTRVLKDHAGMVLRRLSGKTEGAAPVLTLITHFGGGKPTL